jgi:hypothetical protein
MKTYFVGLCCALYIGAQAQTTSTKVYPVKDGQQVNLTFDYPIVKVSTWEKNEVSVIAHVNINGGESDSAFILEDKSVDGVLNISDKIKDMDKLPRRYTVYKAGQKTVYRLKDEYLAAQREGGIQRTSEGLDIDIVVEVKIPVHAVANIKAVYGIVEMTDFNAPVTVEATYGGIDATLKVAGIGKLQATTNYGQIYSNLNLKLTDHTERNFFNSITAEPGKGPAYNFTSKYGKIYLRKP